MQNRGSSTARRKTWLILFRVAQLADVSLVPIAVGWKDWWGNERDAKEEKSAR